MKETATCWIQRETHNWLKVFCALHGAQCQLFFNIEPVTFFILLTALCVRALL
jgi:hypothetical protein